MFVKRQDDHTSAHRAFLSTPGEAREGQPAGG